VDPLHQLIDQPDQLEFFLESSIPVTESKPTTKRGILAYALSVEHCILDADLRDEGAMQLRLTDVTPRYAISWVSSLRKRGVVRTKHCSIEDSVRNSWWTKTLRQINSMHRPTITITAQRGSSLVKSHMHKDDAIHQDDADSKDIAFSAETLEQTSLRHFDQLDEHEEVELVTSANNEAIPTSKAAFKTHPTYVIPSELGKTEVLAPDAKKRICGVFKGQLVYRRSDVSAALTAKKWLYEGRKVRDEEFDKPIKSQPMRKKPTPQGFKALRSYGVGETNDGNEERQIHQGSVPLENGVENLYGVWQTDVWSPNYVGPNDVIPTNEFKNIELALLNPGLVHIDQTGLAGVATKLGIPYAPCLVGFEGHGGNRTPTIRGIVVHQHNEQLLREAGIEMHSYEIEQGHTERRRSVLLLWKRLMVGLLTKDRLDREYGSDH
jgi:xeroderma pigmentosum group C-complementing protein